MTTEPDTDSGLILAAEECPPEVFEQFHKFSSYDEVTIRKLSAHGPVLVRGGRGSGKSALLLEAYRRMKLADGVFPVYMSLRYLPLLQSDGVEYIHHFCDLLCVRIQKELNEQAIDYVFPRVTEQASLQQALSDFALTNLRRIVILFDDAAHIGREKPLEVFFDLFRTLSSSVTSCKASIYPGVTKFGIRFDVFNDSTVIDLSRSDVNVLPDFFPEVVRVRYPNLAQRERFSQGLQPARFANILGRAVVGNMRGFILACNRFDAVDRVGMPELTKCLLDMASVYYWPLMEEVAPKLGVYEALIEPAKQLIDVVLANAVKTVSQIGRPSHERGVVLDRVLIHRQIVGQYAKIFEILEYLGFVSRREASRALKSGGRGPIFAINLCNLLDVAPARRLTFELADEWLTEASEPAEIHISGQLFQQVQLPTLPDENGLAILDKEVASLLRSPIYPYGLTQYVVDCLVQGGITTVKQLANMSDAELDAVENIGDARIKTIRDVLFQAIWM